MLSRQTPGLARWLRGGRHVRASLAAAPYMPGRQKCTIRGSHLNPSGTGGFELAFLGTSSQGGARRYPSCMALRLRGTACSEVWLFDAGEGAMAQLQRSNMRVGLVRNIFVTHLHGDHLYGLPGLVMSVLGRRDVPRRDDMTLNVYGPQGVRTFLRTALGVASFRIPAKSALRINELVWPVEFGAPHQNFRHRCASAYWKGTVKRLSFEIAGRDIEAEVKDGKYTYTMTENEAIREGGPRLDSRWRGAGAASAVAAPVLHTVPTFAFGVTENVVSRRFDKRKLSELGIPTDGRQEVRTLFQKWLTGSSGVWDGQEIDVEEVMQDGRVPRKLCIVGDTYDAEGAAHIAQGVDVLVHEATNMAAQTHIARARGHSSTLGATKFAKKVEAKRLILNHTSVSYSERKIRGMEIEARGMFGTEKAFVARDLSLFSVPTCEEDEDDFAFRRFVGFADSSKPMWESASPFGGQVDVEEADDHHDGEGGRQGKQERASSDVKGELALECCDKEENDEIQARNDSENAEMWDPKMDEVELKEKQVDIAKRNEVAVALG